MAESSLSATGYRELMDLAISRTDHIHARVGYEHGPQVADPRIGKGLQWTQRFERWWDRIIERAKSEGRPWLTINPEFGPPAYQPVHPETGEPLADIWEVCLLERRALPRALGRAARSALRAYGVSASARPDGGQRGGLGRHHLVHQARSARGAGRCASGSRRSGR